MSSSKQSFSSFTDPVERYMYDNFGYLTVIGGAFGFFSSPRWGLISYGLYFLMYSVVLVITLNLMVEVYLVRDNISLLAQSGHICLIGLVVGSASITLTYRRSDVINFINFRLTPDFSEYSKSQYLFLDSLEKRTLKKSKLMLIGWICGYGTCSLVGVVHPLIDAYLGRELTLRQNVTGLYWKSLPFSFCCPWDAHSSYTGWILLFALEGLFAFFAGVMCISAITLCFHVCDVVLDQLKFLIHTLKTLDDRATELLRERYPGVKSGERELAYEDCYYECIRQSAKHFLNIKELFRDFTKTASLPIAVPFFGGALLLALAGITLLAEDDPRLGPKMVFCFLALTEAMNMYLLCLYGAAFQQLTQEVFDALFYARWYRRSLKCRRAIMIFRLATINPLKITAAKLIVLDMNTFSNLVNSAYSIFNVSSATTSN